MTPLSSTVDSPLTTPRSAHPTCSFYVNQVAPLIDGTNVRWIGGIAGLEKERLLQSAAALLTPIRWAEPGGTAVMEALARGVPVSARQWVSCRPWLITESLASSAATRTP